MKAFGVGIVVSLRGVRLQHSVGRGIRWPSVAILGLLAGTVALGTTGCTAAPMVEKKGSTTQKLLAPDPLMKVKASAETKAAFGIDEWRFYRGRGAIFLTGYNAKGKAVKGLGTVFTRTSDGGIDNLQLNVADGSKFTGRAGAANGSVSTSDALSDTSQSFVRRAFLDMSRVGAALGSP